MVGGRECTKKQMYNRKKKEEFPSGFMERELKTTEVISKVTPRPPGRMLTGTRARGVRVSRRNDTSR